jgi:hypothetical protein
MCVIFEGFEIDTNATDDEILVIGAKWLKTTKSRTKKSLCNFISLRDGFNASVPKSDYPSNHLRNMEGISNSQLTRFMHELKGETVKYPARALTFGGAYHENVLEPGKFNLEEWNLRPSEQKMLTEMVFSLIQNQEAFNLYHRSKKEVAKTWIDKATGLKCKGGIDLDISKTDLGDIKTTSARTEKEFVDSLERYDYDRQAAFYLSGVKHARRFWFIGVQKRKPYDVFVISYYCNSKFIRKGRKKVDFLMRKYLELKS